MAARSNGVRYVGRASDAAGTNGFSAVVEFKSEHYLLVAGSDFKGFAVESFDEHALKLRHIASGRPFVLPITSAAHGRQSGAAGPGPEDQPVSSREYRLDSPQTSIDVPPGGPRASAHDAEPPPPPQPDYATITMLQPERRVEFPQPPIGREPLTEDIATLGSVAGPTAMSEAMALLPPMEDYARSNASPFPPMTTPMQLLPPVDISATAGDIVSDNTPPPGDILPR